MSPRIWLAAFVVSAALASPAFAGDADCNFIEITATNEKAGAIDGDLKPLEKKLKKPPFTAWNTFHKLSSGTTALTKNKAEAIKLKQGGASLMLRDRTEKRVELTVAWDGADGKRLLDAKPAIKSGDWLLLVGTNAKDDGHILALTCK
ncbi:MAG TPA: hypothetical protein VMZ53_09975 [Kofleriaceae bacterium]|nr:hypothetical protein [Kofleriaceae bacterium]